MKTLNLAAACAIILLLCCHLAHAQPVTAPSDADTAWKQLQQAVAAWPPKTATNQQPTKEQLFKRNADAAIAVAVEAKNFYTQFPDSTNAAAAKMLEAKMSRRAEIGYRMYRHLHAPGNPLDIKFTAVDGRKVNLSQMKGRVVLVEFWATWCPGCVAEIPQVKEVYDKFHVKGFDVIGISFDTDEKALKEFVQQHDLPWPQYFDGKADGSNKFSSQYGIEGIPVLWLADKHGVLRETAANENLQAKVEKLLVE